MKRCLFSFGLLFSVSAFAQTITAGMTAAQVQTVLNSATCGQIITVQAQSSPGIQAVYGNATGTTGFVLPNIASCQGALVSLTVSGGVVTGYHIDQAGAGFTSNPTVTTFGDFLAGQLNNYTLPTITCTQSGGVLNACSIVNAGSNLLWAAAVVTGGGNEVLLETDHASSLPPAPLGIASWAVLSGSNAGRRVDATNYTTYRQYMPVFTYTNDTQGEIFRNSPGGTPWHLLGLEVTPSLGLVANVFAQALIRSGEQPGAACCGSNFWIDRSFLHGQYWPSNPTTGLSAGGGLQSDNCGTGVQDTAFSGIETGNLIACWGVAGITNLCIGLGGYNTHYIVNNWCEAVYSQVYSGGASVPGLNPATVTSGTTPNAGTASANGSVQITCTSPCDISTLPVNTAIAFAAYVNGPRVNLTSISRNSSGLISATCASACGLLNGAQVGINGVSDNSFNTAGGAGLGPGSAYGPVITSGPSATTFTLQTGNNTAAGPITSSGTVGPGYCLSYPGLPPGPNALCWINSYVKAVSSLGGGQYSLTIARSLGWSYYSPLGGTYPPRFSPTTLPIDTLVADVTKPIINDGTGVVYWLGSHTTNVYLGQNHFQIPTTWIQASIAHSPSWQCKGYFEPKDLQNWRFSGNSFAGWMCGMALNPATSDGGQPWEGIINFGFDNNWTQRFNYDVFSPATGCEYAYCNLHAASSIHYENNLIELPDNALETYSGQVCASGCPNNIQFIPAVYVGGQNYYVQHNTVTQGYNGSAYGPDFTCNGTSNMGGANANSNGDCAAVGFGQYLYNFPPLPTKLTVTWKDNLFGFGLNGISCQDQTTSSSSDISSTCWNQTESNNMIVAINNPLGTVDPIQSSFSAASDIVVNSWGNESPSKTYAGAGANAVRMQNPNSHDYRLCAAVGGNCVGVSVGHNAASDSTDIGVNYTQLDTALGPDNATPITPPSGSTNVNMKFGGTNKQGGRKLIGR